MNRFDWKWNLSDLKQDKDVKVFSCFSCGGGSSMGYKRAGFQVIGNVEIDKAVNAMYCANNHPKYNFNMDLRDFNKLETLPDELYQLDILDGSPPCTTFSLAGKREKTWGQKKKFREGQAEQTLDDLFFVFLDTVEKLQPKIVVAENVAGMLVGNAKGYINQIAKRFRDIGYDVQLFDLNSASMDVPQARRRIFFVANNQGYPKLKLNFNYDQIPFGKVRTPEGVQMNDTALKRMLDKATPADKKFTHVYNRLGGKGGSYYTNYILHDDLVAPTLTSGGTFCRYADRTKLSQGDYTGIQTFPQDYDYNGNDAQYVCGMSVPPNMMANIATEIYEQWLK